MSIDQHADIAELWQVMLRESHEFESGSPELSKWFKQNIYQFDNFQQALANRLAHLLASEQLDAAALKHYFLTVLTEQPVILTASFLDLVACYNRDPACDAYVMPLLYFKGYQSLQTQRLAHHAWHHQQRALAYYLQNQMSCQFGVDIHPAVQLGHGIMLDHATNVVMGETTVVGNNVSILHGVTLGGCGIEGGKRHPNIGDGALISAGAKILGAIDVGEGAKIAAGSLVLENVMAHCTVAGVPAKVVGKPLSENPAEDMDQSLESEQS